LRALASLGAALDRRQGSPAAETGHREGIPVKGPAGSRLFVADGDATLPRLRVAYLVLGETLYIKMIAVG
jgi:hypothetical protein